jgi:hypothetical protein
MYGYTQRGSRRSLDRTQERSESQYQFETCVLRMSEKSWEMDGTTYEMIAVSQERD